MGVFSRTEKATGSEIPHYREDWVFRTTYNYAQKYMLEYNGAYNGSEQFSSKNRFAFFSSGGLGWMLSEEKFMKPVKFLDMLKLRGSYGEIGNDNVSDDRWLYMDQWSYGGETNMGTSGVSSEKSPYTWYSETALGNKNVHWEKVKKTNVGSDFSFFKGFVAGSVDYFWDYRTDILISGDDRAIPSYFGTKAPAANLGIAKAKGYELSLRFNYNLTPNLRLWANVNMTHAENKVVDADEPDLKPAYQKKEGKPINQTYAYLSNGYYNTWDELYGSTEHSTNDASRLPGGYNIVDYNGDGVINTDDQVPYGYSSTPQNTYSTSVGFEWKGFSGYVQFYGVSNVTRQVVFSSLNGSNSVYGEGSYWSENNTSADVPTLRWLTSESDYSSGTRYLYDGSYLRLKNAEIAYTFDKKWAWVKKAGLDNVKLFLGGNNLYIWTDMPDDRESNTAGTGWASQGAYPTMKRYNLGINITF
jgi:TonB-linked SusC/RagA family outer membrane protein